MTEQAPVPDRGSQSPAIEDHRDWFETFYVSAQTSGTRMPWERTGPSRFLEQWVRANNVTGRGRRAVVVGCGLGTDAEYVATLGFETTGFDFAPTAIDRARRRFPDSAVDYRVADLLDLPATWRDQFDLVVESLTVQSMPQAFRAAAIASVRDLVAPSGTLLVLALAHEQDDVSNGPWPLTRADVTSFASGDLGLVRLEELDDGEGRRWRAELRAERSPVDRAR